MNIIISTILSFALIMLQNISYLQSSAGNQVSSFVMKGEARSLHSQTTASQEVEQIQKILTANSNLASKKFTPIPKSKKKNPKFSETDGVCEGYKPKGLCNAYCVAKKCVGNDSNSCESLRKNALKKTGSSVFPCDDTGPTLIQIDSNLSSGNAGTNFVLSASLLNGGNIDIEEVQLDWIASDGQSNQGSEVSFNFTEAGVYEITASYESNGETISESVTLLVYDIDGNIPDLDLPELIGDANGDGEVNLADALLVKQVTNRLQADLTGEERRNADIDFDGNITELDSKFIAEMHLKGTKLPSYIASDAVLPGAKVLIISPELLEVGMDYQVQVGDASLDVDLFTAIPGYGNFFVPFDYATPNTESVDGGVFPVTVLKNGVAVDEFSLTILPTEPLPDDPRVEIELFFTQLEDIVAIHNQGLLEYAQTAGLNDVEQQAILASSEQALEEILVSITELRSVLARPGSDALAELVLRGMRANGLSEFNEIYEALSNPTSASSLATFSRLSPDEVCDNLIPKLCFAQSAFKGIGLGLKVVSGACDVLLGLTAVAILFPGDGPLGDAVGLATWTLACGRLEASLKLVKVLTSLLGSIDIDLSLKTSTNTPSSGNPATITAAAQPLGLDDLCSIGAGKGAKALSKKLAERVVGEIIRDGATGKLLQGIFQAGGEKLLQKFFDAVQGRVGEILDSSGLDKALSELADYACTAIDSNTGALNLPANRVLKGPNPDFGSLSFNSDGTAEYSCPDPSENVSTGLITFTAEKKLCKTTQIKTISLTCETKPVGITIGDNGSLNDDIFEVVINGSSVLTSSSPTRSISTTVQLPVGQTTVTMLGRAAPDGVGTYFIEFSGASVIGGSPTSGSDLIPGSSKTFTIDVQ